VTAVQVFLASKEKMVNEVYLASMDLQQTKCRRMLASGHFL
jgi:hypothetical protein